MCGRYYVDFEALPDALAEEWGLEFNEPYAMPIKGRLDICPGTKAPALIRQGNGFSIKPMKWGFEGSERGLVINARAETIDSKPMYRGIQQRQRCALPAFHYYEWRRGDRQRFEIGLNQPSLFFLAGLYRFGRADTEFVVLTQPPLDRIIPIHDRMPVLLDSASALKAWLGGADPRFTNDGRLHITASGPEQLQMTL